MGSKELKQVDLCRNSAIGTEGSDHNKEVAATHRFHCTMVCDPTVKHSSRS